MADSGYFARVLFSNGEGVVQEDLNNLQDFLIRELRQRALHGFQLAGNAFGLGGSGTADDAELMAQITAPPGALADRILYDPFPLSAPGAIDRTNPGGDLFGEAGHVWAQRQTASTPGTEPGEPAAGAPAGVDNMLIYTGDDEDPNPVITASPAANPRIDVVGVRLGWTDGATAARDFKDAVTGALTSTTPTKERRVQLEQEYIEGAEAASPVEPSLSAGYAKWMTIDRTVAEGTPLSKDVFKLHSYPLGLGSAFIPGNRMWADSASWNHHSSNPESLLRTATSATQPVIFSAPEMHLGCRLVGIAILTDTSDDIDVDIGRLDVANSFTTLENVGNGGAISFGGSDGYYFAGIGDFSAPYWGNGRTYGPLFRDVGSLPSATFTRLAFRLNAAVTWTNGDLIRGAHVLYLY